MTLTTTLGVSLLKLTYAEALSLGYPVKRRLPKLAKRPRTFGRRLRACC